jgi:DNA-binding CsgD family transcriptional regulator
MVGRTFERSSVQADALSEREREVLRAASSGLTNAQMANVLGVTVHTVKFHLASIYRKLGATNRTDAIVRAIRAGITPDPRGDSAP